MGDRRIRAILRHFGAAGAKSIVKHIGPSYNGVLIIGPDEARSGKRTKIRSTKRAIMSRFEHVYVLNVMSDDHPGIVAAVSDAVESLGGNIDSCSQTVLGGYFTLIMIVSVPEPIDPEQIGPSGSAGPSRRGSATRCWSARAGAAEARRARSRADRFVITRLRRGPAGHRPPLQPVPGRQGHQHRRSLRRPHAATSSC